MNKFKEAEYRQNQIGTDFIFCPPDKITRVYINGQIAAASNFPQAQLFIAYKISIPIGWKTQLPDEYQSIQLTQQQLKELNCMESITQSCMPIVMKNQNGSISTQFNFSFPIDVQLLMKDTATQWPVIHFEVFSKDFWDRILIHGCGYAKIPNDPGYYEIKVETWKPHLDTKSKISEFFLGGLIKTKNLEDISKSEQPNQIDQLGPINRYMYNTQSSGQICLILNIGTQNKVIKDNQRANFKAQKFSEQTELKKMELGQTIPSFVNTGSLLAGRFTNTNL